MTQPAKRPELFLAAVAFLLYLMGALLLGIAAAALADGELAAPIMYSVSGVILWECGSRLRPRIRIVRRRRQAL